MQSAVWDYGGDLITLDGRSLSRVYIAMQCIHVFSYGAKRCSPVAYMEQGNGAQVIATNLV